jgi:hypothetical protein
MITDESLILADSSSAIQLVLRTAADRRLHCDQIIPVRKYQEFQTVGYLQLKKLRGGEGGIRE